ncbi:zf-TFIIB domain-containing protein [Desulfobacter latus]|nr:zf-TFIIB domain-containing protein [Desulfobacter latus]
MQHFYSVKREVKVDHCPKCAGYWLDEGELFKIRKQFKTEEERKQAALKYFSELFDGELLIIKKESDEKAKKVQEVTNMFRLILPSHYFSKIKNF